MSEYVEIAVEVECFPARKRAVRDALKRVLGGNVTFGRSRGRMHSWVWAECRTYLRAEDLEVDEDIERISADNCTPIAKTIARACFEANGGPLDGLGIRVAWLERMPSEMLSLPAGTLLDDWG